MDVKKEAILSQLRLVFVEVNVEFNELGSQVLFDTLIIVGQLAVVNEGLAFKLKLLRYKLPFLKLSKRVFDITKSSLFRIKQTKSTISKGLPMNSMPNCQCLLGTYEKD